ncbi:MAG: hypothetical protein IT381_05285 [Deltaproteobacteria bacterium]|nr:hypothetical protein [Deltaproteobacteria bacterium]
MCVLAACDRGYVPPCHVSERGVLLETAPATLGAEPILLLGEDAVYARWPEIVDGVRVSHTSVFGLDGALRAHAALAAGPFDLPSDGAFLGDGEARVSVVRKEIELPEQTVPAPDGGTITFRPRAVQDRLQLERYDLTGAPPIVTPLPLVACEQCFVSALGVRAIGGALLVLWQVSGGDTMAIARVDLEGHVLATRSFGVPSFAAIALQRFRTNAQNDLALLPAARPGGAISLLLLDPQLAEIGEGFGAASFVAWDVASDRLIEAARDGEGDLRARIVSLFGPLSGGDSKAQRLSTDFAPLHAATTKNLSAIVGGADRAIWFIPIDSQGRKIGADLMIDDASNGAASLFGTIGPGALVADGARAFVYFRALGGVVERVRVECR